MLCGLFRDSRPVRLCILIKSTDTFAEYFSPAPEILLPPSSGPFSLPRQSASRAVLVTDAAGRNTLATTLQLIKLQICLFLAAGPKIVSSLRLPLRGWWDLLKHLLSIHFKSYIHSSVSFTLSVTCHIRKSFIAKVTKEQLEAKNPQSPLGSVAGIQITQWKTEVTYLWLGTREHGPFEIWSLRLSVHQDLCGKEKKKDISSLTAGNVKMTRIRLIYIQKTHNRI